MRTRHHPKRNLYETRISVDGKRTSFYGKSVAEAEEKAVAHLRSHHSNSLKEPTLAEFFQSAYLPTVRAHSVKWRQQIGWCWGHVPERIKQTPIKDITRADLQTFLGGLKLGRSSVGHVRKVLHAVFALAEADDLIARNPVRAVKLAPDRSQPLQPYGAGELRRLVEASKGLTCHNAIVLAGVLGLRQGECLGLKWSDIRGGNIHVERQPSGPLKTSASRRVLPMPAGLPLAPNGSEWVVETRSARNLLGSVRGQRGYAWAVAKAGLPHRTFHSLRKSCATELEKSGCPQGLISAILGHSGGSVTRLYIHNDAEMMRRYLEAVCLAIRGVQSGVQGPSQPGQNEGEPA